MMPMERRALLQRVLSLVGAATVAPAFSFEALAKAAEAPPLLDTAHFSLLSAVADTMIPVTDTPGALAAGVPKLFDSLLRNWAAPQRRTDLIAALARIDAAAREKAGQGFAKLTPQQRHDFLSTYDAQVLQAPPPGLPVPANPLKAAPSVADPNYGRLRQDPFGGLMGAAKVVDPAYAKVKELIVVLFYYSETALTHDLEYEHAPGQWNPSVPVTAQTRQTGGAGLA